MPADAVVVLLVVVLLVVVLLVVVAPHRRRDWGEPVEVVTAQAIDLERDAVGLRLDVVGVPLGVGDGKGVGSHLLQQAPSLGAADVGGRDEYGDRAGVLGRGFLGTGDGPALRLAA